MTSSDLPLAAEWTTDSGGTHKSASTHEQAVAHVANSAATHARMVDIQTARRNEMLGNVLLALTSTSLAVQATAPCDVRDKLSRALDLLVGVHNELVGLATSH